MSDSNEFRLLAVANDSVTAGLIASVLEQSGIRVLGGRSFTALNAGCGDLTHAVQVLAEDWDRARQELSGGGLEKWLVR